MSEDDQVAAAVRALEQAYSERESIRPLRETFPELSIDTAYEIQLEQVRRWREQGRAVRGHKIGLTSRPMQQMLGVDQPDFGHLVDGMFYDQDEPIPASEFLAPKVEPEVAFLLSQPLRGPGLTAADAVEAIESVVPAVEIIDSRVRDWDIRIEDTIADNASSAGVVLGDTHVRLEDHDLESTGCRLIVDGETVATGTGAEVFGGPIGALVWLANALGERGNSMETGDVVLSGSWTAAVSVAAGSTVRAEFDGMGSVDLRFAEGSETP